MNFEQADALNEAIRAIGTRHRSLAIAALTPLGIHPGHKVMLLLLAGAGPRTQGQLAVASGYEPPTITESVRQLESAGLVTRRPSPSDGRAMMVELTEEGRALVPRLKAAWRELAERTVAGLSSTRREQVVLALNDLAASLAASDAPHSGLPRFHGRSRARGIDRPTAV